MVSTQIPDLASPGLFLLRFCAYFLYQNNSTVAASTVGSTKARSTWMVLRAVKVVVIELSFVCFVF
jgi:hypothetical protein